MILCKNATCFREKERKILVAEKLDPSYLIEVVMSDLVFLAESFHQQKQRRR